ncbi:MAG: hypothetical protein RLZZ628_1224 [Bacteroidota bacterium]|jgi:hypothetical protein
MTINQLNKLKVPIFKINPQLNELAAIPMFEEKVAMANEILRTVGLPDLPPPAPKRTRKVKKKVSDA